MKYDEFKSLIVNSSPDKWIYDDEMEKYIFTDDIKICITRDRSCDKEDFFEDWARKFSDPNAKKVVYELNYNGNTIEKFYTVAVDGYRNYIPFPKLQGMTITREQHSIGKIINKHLDEVGLKFDEYLLRAGIKVQD